MFRAYNDINYFMNLDYDIGIKMLWKLKEKNEEKKCWEMWLVQYGHMTKETFVKFEDFYKPKQIEISDTKEEDIFLNYMNIKSQKKAVK